MVASDDDTLNQPYDMWGTADYFSTVELSRLAVFSNSNAENQVGGVSTSALSGTDYPLDGPAAVPEPATFVLFGAAFPLLALGRRFRKSL